MDRAPWDYYLATAQKFGIPLEDIAVPYVPNGLSRKTVDEIIASPELIKGDLPYAMDYLSKSNGRGTALGVTEKLFVDRKKLKNLMIKGSNIESTLNLEYTLKIFLSDDVPLVGKCTVVDEQITEIGIYIPVPITRHHPTDVIAQWVNTKQNPKPFFPADLFKKESDYKKTVEWMLQEYARTG